MAPFSVKVQIRRLRKDPDGESRRYRVFYGSRELFSFVNRWKGEWLFFSHMLPGGRLILKFDGVPTAHIYDIAKALVCLSDDGVMPDELDINLDFVKVNPRAPLIED